MHAAVHMVPVVASRKLDSTDAQTPLSYSYHTQVQYFLSVDFLNCILVLIHRDLSWRPSALRGKNAIF